MCASKLLVPPQGIAEVKERLVVAPPSYVIKVVDKNGIREVKRV
jgi:20S proteasome subunit beta 4